MAGRTFDEEVVQELVGKAVMWVPAIASTLCLSLFGMVAWLVTSVVMIASGNNGGATSSHRNLPTE